MSDLNTVRAALEDALRCLDQLEASMSACYVSMALDNLPGQAKHAKEVCSENAHLREITPPAR